MSHNKPYSALLFCLLRKYQNKTCLYWPDDITVRHVPVYSYLTTRFIRKSCKAKYCSRIHSIYNVQLWFWCTAIYNLVAKQTWRLLHEQLQFFIACLSQNVGKAVLYVCILIQGDAPNGSTNWKAWAAVTSVWLGWENALLKNTEKFNFI